MTGQQIIVSDWTSRQAGTLRGFFSASLPSCLVFHEMTLHTRDGAWWIGFPAKPLLQDGAALRDENGKIRYSPPLISFTNRQARERFTEQVLAALRQTQPQLFAAAAVA
jgi:hypothetical protein